MKNIYNEWKVDVLRNQNNKVKRNERDGILEGYSGSLHTPVHYTKSSILEGYSCLHTPVHYTQKSSMRRANSSADRMTTGKVSKSYTRGSNSDGVFWDDHRLKL